LNDLSFSYYMQLNSPESEQSFKARMDEAGYYAFYTFVGDFREGLRSYSDADIPRFARLLDIGRALFPHPEKFSPSWSGIWDEFDCIFNGKNDALATVPADQRDGEWQVLIDNPYLTQQVVCYPGLVFLEGAYMYGYFQRELKPNENLRLQRITSLLSTHGRKDVSLFPSVGI